MKFYKYDLPIAGVGEIILPVGAKITQALIQDGKFVFWALVDENEKRREMRKFELYMTGKSVEGDVKTIYNTIYDVSSGLVFHFVELKK